MQLRFGGYCLDLGTRQLFRGETEVGLSPKAFDLLRALVENRTRALSKTELHDRLWPGTFVTEANLAVLVGELRRALNDRPTKSKFVRTVHRFGYAFCGEISAPVEVPASSASCWVVWGSREIALHHGVNIIGRDADAAVRLDFPSVSRRHARIVVSPDGVEVEDLGSKNGTWVAGERIRGTAALTDGTTVRLGSETLRFEIVIDERPTKTAIVP